MKLSKKYWIAIICKVGTILTSFLITIFINRGLGAAGKGEYTYIIKMVEMLYVFCSVGLGQTYATFKKSEGEGVRGTFIALGLIHGAAVLLMGGLVVTLFPVEYGAIIVFLTSLATMKVVVSMLAVIESSIKRNVIITALNIANLLVLVTLYVTRLCDLQTALLCYGCTDVLTILWLMLSYKMVPSLKDMNLSKLKSIYGMGMITMIVMLLISINYSIDTIMLRELSDSYHTGIYSVGVAFSNMFLLIPDAFKEVLFGDSTKKSFAKDAAFSSIKVSLAVLAVIFIGFVVFGEFAISLFYGVEFEPSYKVTLVLFLGSISMVFFKILQPVYIAYGKQKKAAIILTCSATLNILVNLVLIPKYQSIGAAIATAISYTLCGVVFLVDYIRSHK